MPDGGMKVDTGWLRMAAGDCESTSSAVHGQLVHAYLRLRGWHDAADLLDHYVDGSGDPVDIDANRLLHDSPTFKQDPFISSSPTSRA